MASLPQPVIRRRPACCSVPNRRRPMDRGPRGARPVCSGHRHPPTNRVPARFRIQGKQGADRLHYCRSASSRTSSLPVDGSCHLTRGSREGTFRERSQIVDKIASSRDITRKRKRSEPLAVTVGRRSLQLRREAVTLSSDNHRTHRFEPRTTVEPL